MVIELRQYELEPGRREELIELFDAHLAEPQEEAGMRLLGRFRDLDRPDWFVWLRGFPDMERRTATLEAFYLGPVWRRHRDAANATMIDSDNVLLLRPAAGSEPDWEPASGTGFVEIVVAGEFAGHAGGAPIAVLETEPAPNGFPALPVREGESVVVTITGFEDAADHARHRERPPSDAQQLLRLEPTGLRRLGPRSRNSSG